MKIDEYITHLRRMNIVISVVDNRLAIDAPDEVLTSEVVEEIRAKKPVILDFFDSLNESKSTSILSIPQATEQEYYPLSSAQKRMYFLYEFDNESTSYNMPTFYRIKGDLDVLRLKSAFQRLIARHESLHTIFEIKEGVPVQRILKANSFKISHHSVDSSNINRYIDDFIRPFDLSEDFPVRLALMEVHGEDPLLLIDIHHIINDGVSQKILMQEFWSLYHEYELPTLRIQYKDYVIWQQSQEYQDIISAHKDYWLETYSEEITALNLPLDRSRSLYPNNEGNTVLLQFDQTSSNELRSLASKECVTLYTLFLTIYNIFLGKLSNQTDIIVGTPTAGRYHTDLEYIVGMFVNTLALRNQIVPNKTFKDFLTSVHESTISAFDHQLYQYDELVEALGLPRDTGRNPLFDVFFSYDQQISEMDFDNSAIEISNYEVPYDVAKFDLSLSVLDSDRIELFFNYRVDLFEKGTIKRFCEFFNRIVSQILSDESIRLSDIDILSKGEKNLIINEFNNPSLDRNIDGLTIIDLIEEQVFRAPSANALYFQEITIDYSEMDFRVNQLANYLIEEKEVKTGDRLGLYIDRSPEMVIGLLAIMKTGAIYIPLDPINPAQRNEMLIRDADVAVIVTNSPQNKLVGINTNLQVVDMEREELQIAKKPGTAPKVSIKGSDPAYILYTSGTTGIPKGVVVEHSSLLDYVITFKEYFELITSDKVVQQTSPSFDTVVEEIFPALISGASVIIIPEGGRDIDALVKGIKYRKATVLSTVPIVLNFLNDHHSDELKSLRLIISGGDLLLPAHINNLIKHYSIYNTYGPTESTVCITYHKVEDLDNVSCIGRPITNRQVFILNKDEQICPLGVVGELCVSGKGLAKGYLNDDKLTNDKFINNPIIPGSRIYRTGDAAKWNADGTITFVGRIDDQIKIRGVRIELKEIESQLESMEEVSQALVMVHGSGDSKSLVAYMCGSLELSRNEFYSRLSNKLPGYMIPAIYVWLKSFPLNANGKIDRKALPSPKSIQSELYMPPENEIHKKLVSVWSDLLNIKVDEISITSDFFNIGGHSLLAVKLRHQIKGVFDIDIPLFEFFLSPTIRLLSEKIQELKIPHDEQKIIIPLNNSKSGNNLFFIHDGSGEVDGYLTLANQLEDYKCHGIRFNVLDGTFDKAPTIKGIASRYIKEMKSIQTEGPYHLLGWSLGGEIAAEMTWQLENANEKVENLVMVDSYLKYKRSSKTVFDVKSEIELLKSQFGFSPDKNQSIGSLNEVWSQFAISETFKNISIEEARTDISENIVQLIPDYLNKDKIELFEAVNKVRLLIVASENYYLSETIHAKTLYVLPSQSNAVQNIQMFVKSFPNIDLHQVSGDHFSIMRLPEVADLAAKINKHITCPKVAKKEEQVV